MINSYKDLIVWQKSIKLVVKIYGLTKYFPKEEIYGLISQMRRCSVSIPSNIAESNGRGTRKDYANFIKIALGSANELETQIVISKELPETKNLNYEKIDSLLIEIMKMLVVLHQKLKT